ncbi:MAG: magnesium transporter [Proteobacteria bacterium]|nr:magnesium transporter [Pseudomonadota bacterium]
MPMLGADVIWLDLLNPTPEEEKAYEAILGIELPLREEMRSIEPSSRLYRENDALYMTATIVAKADTADADAAAMAFILKGNLLITIRYNDPRSFSVFSAHLERHPEDYPDGISIFCGLLEAIIERAAEVLEFIGAESDKISHSIFSESKKRKKNGEESHARILRRIALLQNLMAKMRESLTSLGRIMHFSPLHEALREHKHQGDLLRSVDRDIHSLNDQAAFLGNSIAFLLNASLGLINIEQNGIIKFFSVVAVIFLPPTLIASIYGMNFEFMPELHWHLGYPIALALMFLSAVCPYMWFKFKRWL